MKSIIDFVFFHIGDEAMGWIYVFFAAFVEIFWVLGLKYSTNALMWTGTVITIIFSFYFIIKACDVLPSGTVRSEEHTSELQSRFELVCRLLLETKEQSLVLNYKVVS